MDVLLRCPRCRGYDDDGVFVAQGLRRVAQGLACQGPGCAATYPVVDSIPVIAAGALADPLGALEASWPPDVGAWCRELGAADPTSARFVESWLMGTYAVAHHPASAPARFVADALRDQGALEAALRQHVPAVDGAALEVGAGLGGFAPLWLERATGPVVALDLRAWAARLGRRLHRGEPVSIPWRRVGRAFEPIEVHSEAVAGADRLHYLLGDALNPPLAAERFALVVALNLVDAVSDPWTLLGQLDALLAPGGVLVLGQPYHYEPHAQAPAAWIEGPGALLQALRGGPGAPGHLRYRVVAEVPDLPWSLPAHDRLVHRYGVHLVVARREGEG